MLKSHYKLFLQTDTIKTIKPFTSAKISHKSWSCTVKSWLNWMEILPPKGLLLMDSRGRKLLKMEHYYCQTHFTGKQNQVFSTMTNETDYERFSLLLGHLISCPWHPEKTPFLLSLFYSSTSKHIVTFNGYVTAWFFLPKTRSSDYFYKEEINSSSGILSKSEKKVLTP